MKRIKESGASFRKKEKVREKIQNKNAKALVKYLSVSREETSSNIVEEERPASSTGEEAGGIKY